MTSRGARRHIEPLTGKPFDPQEPHGPSCCGTTLGASSPSMVELESSGATRERRRHLHGSSGSASSDERGDAAAARLGALPVVLGHQEADGVPVDRVVGEEDMRTCRPSPGTRLGSRDSGRTDGSRSPQPDPADCARSAAGRWPAWLWSRRVPGSSARWGTASYHADGDPRPSRAPSRRARSGSPSSRGRQLGEGRAEERGDEAEPEILVTRGRHRLPKRHVHHLEHGRSSGGDRAVGRRRKNEATGRGRLRRPVAEPQASAASSRSSSVRPPTTLSDGGDR